MSDQPPDQLDLSDLTKEEEDELCFDNPLLFAVKKLRGSMDPPYYGEFLIGQHHIEWAETAMSVIEAAKSPKNKRPNMAMIQAARDFGKSYFWLFTLSLWLAWRSHKSGEPPPPATTHLHIFSSTNPKAAQHLGMIRTELESNPEFAFMLPDPDEPQSSKKWGALELRLRNGFILTAAGWKTAVRGGHPLYIFLDDVLSDKSTWSSLTRARDEEYFDKTVLPMLRPGGSLFLIGTPMHRKDLYEKKRFTKMFEEVQTPAITSDGQAAWPEVYPLEHLNAKRESMTAPGAFEREYELKFTDSGLSLFPMSYFDTIRDPRLMLNGSLSDFEEIYGPLEVWHGVDLAFTTGEKSDFSVVFTYGITSDGLRVVLAIDMFKTEDPAVHLKRIENAWMAYGGVAVIESNAGQRLLGIDVALTTQVPVELVQTGTDKRKAEVGIPSLRTLFAQKRFVWPVADTDDFELLELLWEQLHGFVYMDGALLSSAEHDDVAMALWVVENGRRRSGASGNTATGEPDLSHEAVQAILAEYQVSPATQEEILAQYRPSAQELPEGGRHVRIDQATTFEDLVRLVRGG